MAKVLVDGLSAEIAACTTASRRNRYKSWLRASVHMRFALYKAMGRDLQRQAEHHRGRGWSQGRGMRDQSQFRWGSVTGLF